MNVFKRILTAVKTAVVAVVAAVGMVISTMGGIVLAAVGFVIAGYCFIGLAVAIGIAGIVKTTIRWGSEIFHGVNPAETKAMVQFYFWPMLLVSVLLPKVSLAAAFVICIMTIVTIIEELFIDIAARKNGSVVPNTVTILSSKEQDGALVAVVSNNDRRVSEKKTYSGILTLVKNATETVTETMTGGQSEPLPT